MERMRHTAISVRTTKMETFILGNLVAASASPRFATRDMLYSETSQPLFGHRGRDAQPHKDLLVIKVQGLITRGIPSLQP